MPARHLAIASLFVLGLVACGGDDGGAGIDAALGDPSLLTGSMGVELVHADPLNTTVSGRIDDGVDPPETALTAMTTDGDCQLLIPSFPFCAPPCAPDVCVATDTCVRNQIAQDVGTMHITGVHTADGASEFDLAVVGSNIYQTPGAITLAYPGFAEGDPITVTASGSAFTPAFTMTAPGIAPLVITSSEPLLDRNPVTVTWTPPASGATSRILVKVEIAHHGGFRGQIECDTADDGSLTLGATILSQLLDLGVAGFPTIELTRETVGTGLTTAGRVELSVRSMISQSVTIPGVISCTDDTQCTAPATCQDDLTCR